MIIRIICISILLSLIITRSHSQILFTESFNVILDSNKTAQGSIVPNFKFQTQKKVLLEFENMADITFKIKNSALTFANKIELSRFGDEVIMSGGYVYAEYRGLINKVVVPEIYSQVHWAEARGMEFKYAGGIYARFRIAAQEKIGFFVGVGPFYEYERWNYEGVQDTSLIPANPNKVITQLPKMAAYINLKWKPLKKISLDLSTYYQSRYDWMIEFPRLASSSQLAYQINDNISLIFMYQNIYDFKPGVPIDNWFHRVIGSIGLSF